MIETTINALVMIFMVAFLVTVTVIIVVGGVYLVWSMVTDFIDAIREREEAEGETE